MPQLSLYVDKKMMKRLEEGADGAKLSISKYVNLTLQKSFESDWPVGYAELFGSLDDPSFERPEQPGADLDLKREPV